MFILLDTHHFYTFSGFADFKKYIFNILGSGCQYPKKAMVGHGKLSNTLGIVFLATTEAEKFKF